MKYYEVVKPILLIKKHPVTGELYHERANKEELVVMSVADAKRFGDSLKEVAAPVEVHKQAAVLPNSVALVTKADKVDKA